MNKSVEIAKTICQQLRYEDYLRPARWAAREYIALSEGDEGESIGKIQGGVRFKVSGTKNIKRGGYVYVYLTWDDTYTVKVVKVRGNEIKTLKLLPDVYCDNLGEVIDHILEN